ncbi:protein angel homolog 2-like [Dendronephthya gigantea]|uniref:protein angel homolog 2-like n=1 Tax=Dendronephthya gigantea TaxID=151771 RepID=UPI00106A42F7|nr:protein angel homolog 2-like [Dendronephthya gigantea]
MKRGYNEIYQPSVRPRVPVGHRNASFPRSQFRYDRSESVNKAIIRNNSQLSFGTDQINPESQSFEARGGQYRPHLGGRNHHQGFLPSAMSRFAFGARQIRPIASYPMFFQSGFRSAFNHYPRSTPQGIPSNTLQFQEAQRHWNARFTQSQNGMRTNNSSLRTRERGQSGHRDERGKAFSHRNKFSMRREWQALIPEAGQCRPDEFSFSIVTYNILSDSLLYENMFLYEECYHEDLGWEFRKEKLLSELLGYDAEILCLQEVDACHYENWFRPKLHEAGYTGLFVQRTGGKPDGCAIFFRNAKFSLVKYKLVEYNTPKVSVLDKDNVGIVLLLKANTSRTENSFLCIANTHLLFNKKRGDIKLAQLAYLFAEINELAVLSKNGKAKTSCPIILCGDMNSMPYSPLYHFLISGQLEYSARSPAVISGQLGSSEARSGPSSKRIRTPLLPWEFGVTAGCQWREKQREKSEDRCACARDRETSVSESEVFDLRTNTHSSRHKTAESNSLDFNDFNPQTNNSERQHHDTPVSTTSSGDKGCESEKLKYNKNGSLSIPWQFTSVYMHRFPDGTPEVTTCHSKACCNVDYIFYTATGGRGAQTTEHKKHVQKGELTLLGRLRLMKKSDFDTMRLLPNRIFPSDHLSLMARFKLT